MKILLIGAGQLGSRHLQSCLKLKTSATIYVVDECEDSLELTKTRANEIDSSVSHDTIYSKNLPDLKENHIDFLIIATGAGPRLLILDSVLQKYTIKFAILEKVLFQDLESYKKAKDLLNLHQVRCFVNCPLRAYPVFKQIKSQFISKENPTTIEYKGGEWIGLACNSIHYLDLMNYLTSELLIDIKIDNLDDGYIPSKRPGNVEFTGQIIAEYSKGSKLSVKSIRKSDKVSVISIINGKYRIDIEELTGKYKVFESNVLKSKNQYEILYQSDLTHKMIQQMKETNSCELIHFEDSTKIHEIFIRKLLKHYNKHLAEKKYILPIT